MYGKTAIDFPQRIVCLTAETAEIAFLVGAGDRVVGVPGTARRPEAARERARVGGFTTFRTDRILALEPDLVLAFSDLQNDIVARADRRRRGGALHQPALLRRRAARDPHDRRGAGREPTPRARSCRTSATRSSRYREYSAGWPDRPRVYFEEWMDPLDRRHPLGVGADRDRRRPATSSPSCARGAAPGSASSRPRRSSRRDPQIILASWCGKPVDPAAIAARPGWSAVAAVAAGQIHEIAGEDVLAPGPSLMHGLRRIHEIIQTFQSV